MVFNVTFNNMSAISWRSVILSRKSEYPEKTIYNVTTASHYQILSHNVTLYNIIIIIDWIVKTITFNEQNSF
jgi:mRNA deadenylase 3'-5' endonuclease subunit Ccr4